MNDYKVNYRQPPDQGFRIAACLGKGGREPIYRGGTPPLLESIDIYIGRTGRLSGPLPQVYLVSRGGRERGGDRRKVIYAPLGGQ